MARQKQTKLMKMICKRAAAMRAPYHQAPWTSERGPMKKKVQLAKQGPTISNGQDKVANKSKGIHH